MLGIMAVGVVAERAIDRVAECLDQRTGGIKIGFVQPLYRRHDLAERLFPCLKDITRRISCPFLHRQVIGPVGVLLGGLIPLAAPGVLQLAERGLFVDDEMGNEILYGPFASCASCLQFRFGEGRDCIPETVICPFQAQEQLGSIDRFFHRRVFVAQLSIS